MLFLSFSQFFFFAFSKIFLFSQLRKTKETSPAGFSSSAQKLNKNNFVF
jgi:hypothetical protein